MKMFYLVNGYRFTMIKKLKMRAIDADKICVQKHV